jgi:hypothetical protein
VLDITLAIVQGALMLLTAYLGVHVTLHPAESDISTRRYKAGFAGCALIACCLIGVQAYRSNQGQAALRKQLNAIERNTKQAPKVEVNVPPPRVILQPSPLARLSARVVLKRTVSSYFETTEAGKIITNKPMAAFVAGRPISYNLTFENGGGIAAERFRAIGKVFLGDKDDELTEARFKEAFLQWIPKVPPYVAALEIGSDNSKFITASSDEILTSEDVQQKLHGAKVVYIFAETRYADPTGSHYIHYCSEMQPPVLSQAGEIVMEVWHDCHDFSDRH